MAESTQVVITTVGPYIHYGEPLVAACAAAGTDYVDLTGEPEFVDRMWLGYHDAGASAPARGWCTRAALTRSPTTSGVLFTVQQLPEGVPLAVEGFVRAGGTFSGGTFHSAVHIMGRLRQGARSASERQRAGAAAGRAAACAGSPGRPHDVAGGRRLGRAVPDHRPPDGAALGAARWTATAPTSATATTWSSSACRWWPGWSPAPAR